MRERQSQERRARARERSRRQEQDAVERAGEESFPASDPPEWPLSSALPDVPPEELDASRRALKQQLRAVCGQ